MKVAIVHDWLTGYRGGEKCLQAFLEIYKTADIFTLIHVPGSTTKEIDARVKKVSWLSKIPGVSKHYRKLLLLFPLAIRSFDLRGYDLVISLSHAAAKNIRIPKDTKHICYCFTPMRYIWDQAPYYLGKKIILFWPLIKILRIWDRQGAKSVDEFIAISKFVAARIRCYYKRRSKVVYPPVDTRWIKNEQMSGEYFLYAGALVPYKRVGVIVKAFNKLGLPLVIAGNGTESKRLKSISKSNIKFIENISDEKLALLFGAARALVFSACEDFGMIPVECQAAGKPVIALYAGGVKETINGVFIGQKVEENDTGIFYKNNKNEVENLINAIRFFIENESRFNKLACISKAKEFSKERFINSFAC